MPGGNAYLCAVMDWYSKKVLGWAVSNTMETSLCLEALDKALANTGKVPEIFNTDQGCRVHLGRVDRSPQGTGNQNQHVWQRSLDGQRLHRTAMEVSP